MIRLGLTWFDQMGFDVLKMQYGIVEILEI